MARFTNDIIEGLPAEAIKDGRVFRAFFEGSLAAAATKDFMLHTTGNPETTRVYLRDLQIVASDSPLLGRIYGGSNITSDGTPATTFNINLTSTRTSNTELFEDPVYTGGLLRDVELVPSGSQGGANIASGSSNFTQFMRVLPADVKFILNIENIGATTARYVVKAIWEEIP